jgi:hypothetical protein
LAILFLKIAYPIEAVGSNAGDDGCASGESADQPRQDDVGAPEAVMLCGTGFNFDE